MWYTVVESEGKQMSVSRSIKRNILRNTVKNNKLMQPKWTRLQHKNLVEATDDKVKRAKITNFFKILLNTINRKTRVRLFNKVYGERV